MDSTLIYQKRINLAVDYLSVHYAQPVTLAQAAAAAGFSQYHFHRLFSAIVGETPADYLQRIRLEMAANFLLKSTRTVAQIACDSGFSSPAVFTRLFSKIYGVPPSAYRRAGIEPARHIPEEHTPLNPVSDDFVLRPLRVQPVDDLRVFYLACYDGYRIESICAAWDKLFRWVGLRGWMTPQSRAFGLSLDDPSITRSNRCRYYACLTVPPMAAASHPVAEMILPAGTYALFEAQCRADEIRAIYASIYHDWLPASGYEPGNSFPFEEYLVRPEQHPRGLYELLVWVPVVPLQN